MSDPAPAPEPDVRAFVYDSCRTRGLPPSAEETASALDRRVAEIRAAFARLAEAHVLVLQPDGEILMAPPYSAVPTPFPVRGAGPSAYGNCIWDALGIPARGRGDATILGSCACCGERLDVEVAGGSVRARGGIIHFALPARKWWDNIVFT